MIRVNKARQLKDFPAAKVSDKVRNIVFLTYEPSENVINVQCCTRDAVKDLLYIMVRAESMPGNG